MNISDCYNYEIPMIDDFESDLFWELECKGESQGWLDIIGDNHNKFANLIYAIQYSKEKVSPHQVNMVLRRKMDLSQYKGIKFSARGTPRFILKIKLYEKENYYKEEKKEIWYKMFTVSPEWKDYQIAFDQMEVTEYYEQDYVSNDLQELTNVSGIGFSVQNNIVTQNVKGEFCIDNVQLYN